MRVGAAKGSRRTPCRLLRLQHCFRLGMACGSDLRISQGSCDGIAGAMVLREFEVELAAQSSLSSHDERTVLCVQSAILQDKVTIFDHKSSAEMPDSERT